MNYSLEVSQKPKAIHGYYMLKEKRHNVHLSPHSYIIHSFLPKIFMSTFRNSCEKCATFVVRMQNRLKAVSY